MRVSTFWYCVKQGIINICRNVWFSLASMAIISACIFLFCMFFALVANMQFIAKNAESTVGITVFFDEELTESQIEALGQEIGRRSEVKEITYVSASEAWDTFKAEYFKDMEDLAEGFSGDNPLADSASYEIFLHDISMQGDMVAFLESLDGIRRVNFSSDVASGLMSFNKVLGLISAAIILVLLAVAVFLINNTISVAAAFRKSENKIMKLIGATNFMIRAPFVVEGIIIGFIGAALPLVGIYYLYNSAVVYLLSNFSILSGIITFLPIDRIYPYMVSVALLLGVGIGFFGSFFTIRKHLKV